MSRIRPIAVSAGLAGLVGMLIPIWLSHQVATRVASAGRHARTADIPRLAAATTSLADIFAGRRPVILDGLVDLLGLPDVASPEGLAAAVGQHDVTVTSFDASSPYFLYSGGYGTTVLDRRTMSFAEFEHLMFERGVEPGSVVYQLFGINSLGGAVRRVLTEFDHAVQRHTDHPTEPRFSGVWIGSPGAVTPLHHDAWPGLLFQTHGTKRVAMYAPADRTNLYFRNPLRGAGRWSDLPGRSADADDADYPRLRHTVRYVGELRSGDGLFVPPFWAHEMEAREANVSVPFRFAGPRRTYLNPGFLRPASELLRKNLRAATAR